jgi:hypothetical protein
MDPGEARIVYESQNSPEACQREIDEFEDHCRLDCGKIAPLCNTCDVPAIIAQLKKRKRDLINQGE